MQVLDKFDEASYALKSSFLEKEKRTLEEGTALVSKRVKATQLTDKNKVGRLTVNEYLSDELASNPND